MNKNKVLLVVSIAIVLVFVGYQVFRIETKRLAEFHEKQKIVVELPKETSNKKQESLDERIKQKLPHYKILEISTNNKTKCVVYVSVKKKLDNKELYLLALDVKDQANPLSGRLHIFVLLPEMRLGNGAWVRIDLNPDFNIIHLGQTIETEEIIRKYVGGIKDYVGLWCDNSSNLEVLTRIRNDKTLGLIQEYISPIESKSNPQLRQLKQTIKNGKRIITFVDKDYLDYYVLENNNDLSIYDDKGYVLTLRMLAFKGFKNK